MFKNVAGQQGIFFAFNTTNNVAQSGDAANITPYVSKDYGTVTVLSSTSMIEMDATNGKGYYRVTLTQSETNADTLVFTGKSSTANIAVIGVPATVMTTPNRFTTLVIDSAGLADSTAVKVGPSGSATAQTAKDVGISVPGIAAGAVGGLFLAGALNSGTTSLTALTINSLTAFTGAVSMPAGLTANITGNLSGSVNSVLTKVTANVHTWIGGTIPAVTVTGVPLVDVNYFLGTTSAGTAGYAGIDWQNVRAATTVVGLTNTTISNTQVVASVSGSVATVLNKVTANVHTWLGGTIPAVNVTGVPLVDVNYFLGTTSAGTAGYAGIDWQNVRATTAVVTMTNTKIGSVLTRVTANVDLWIGGVIPAVNVTGVPIVDTTYLEGTQSAGNPGYVGVDWQNVRAQTTVVTLINTTFSTSQVVSTITNPVTVGTINASAAKYKKNVALSNFGFTMQDSTTGADKTGLTVASKFALDGGTFSATSSSVAEIALGWYQINLIAAEMNGTFVKLQFTATGAINRDIEITTQP